VWLCSHRRQELLECIQLTQDSIYIGIEEFTGTMVSAAQRQSFEQAHFWNLAVDMFQFDFIDLTKGLVPNEMVSLLMSMGCLEHQANSLITSSLQILYNFMWLHLWKLRCNDVAYAENIHGITSRMKRGGLRKLSATVPAEDTQGSVNNSARSSLRSSSVTNEEWFIWSNYVCHYGGTHLDFYSTHDMSP
jgi:hypothetical protein